MDKGHTIHQAIIQKKVDNREKEKSTGLAW